MTACETCAALRTQVEELKAERELATGLMRQDYDEMRAAILRDLDTMSSHNDRLVEQNDALRADVARLNGTGESYRDLASKWQADAARLERERDDARELVRCVEIGVRTLGISPGLKDEVLDAVRRWRAADAAKPSAPAICGLPQGNGAWCELAPGHAGICGRGSRVPPVNYDNEGGTGSLDPSDR